MPCLKRLRSARPPLDRNESGQGLVEFAIALPLLIMFLVVIIHYGIIIWVAMNIASSTREAALYGAYKPDNDTDIKSTIQAGLPSFLDVTYITISVTDSGNRNKGSQLTISVKYDLANGGMEKLPCGALLPAPNKLFSTVTIPIVVD